MSEPAEKLMTVDEFLDWSSAREGKHELHEGRPVAMSPERVRHVGMKGETYSALKDAISRAGLPCRVYVDGVTVRVRRNRALVPDVLVACPALPPDAIEIENPLIVVEVVSPSTSRIDHSYKLESYLSLPGLAHYLILDPETRVVIHHARIDPAQASTRILRSGLLRLDPPGIEVAVEAFFEPA